ncbi:MAG: hypothetical protein KDB68_05060 [Planctomycetes bacterium]|nr:hypothetical protein [Planctomycetota bacterium]
MKLKGFVTSDSFSAKSLKVLTFLKEAEGRYRSIGTAMDYPFIFEEMKKNGYEIDVRMIRLVMEEACDNGLIDSLTTPVDSEDGYFFMRIDISGKGLRFVEAVERLAEQEGKKAPWLWSFVEKAADLAQLMSFAVQAFGRS